MFLKYILLVKIIFGYFCGIALTGCTRSSDYKVFTCSDLQFYQFRTSPNNKDKIIQASIVNCKETTISEDVLPFLNLEYLKISCGIKTIDKNAFGNLNNLKELDLSNNLLQSEPNMFETRTELQVLNLSGNNFEELKQNVFKGLNNLKKLSLSYNKISTLNQRVFDQTENIESLLLNNNHISFMPTGIFNKLKKLSFLDLSQNNIKHIGDLFISIYYLRYLNLSHNAIADIAERTFLTTNLEILDLSYNKLTMIPKNSLKLDVLTELYLQYNQIFLLEINGTNFDVIPLNFLDLRHNQLVYLEEHFVRIATNLSILKVEENPWDCKCFEQIEKLRGNSSLYLSIDYHLGEEPICVVKNKEKCKVDKGDLKFYYDVLVKYWHS